MLSNSIATYVEKLLGNNFIKPNTWVSTQIISDSYLDLTYESKRLKSKYKQTCLIHNRLVYYPDLDLLLTPIKSVLEEKLGCKTSISKYLVELHIANSTDS
jgi:hypothetical protein